MDLFTGRAVVTDARLAELPGKKDIPAFMQAAKFNVAVFDIPEETAHRKDRFDILGQVLDRLLQRVDTVLQAVVLFEKPLRLLGRANKLMHEKEIVGAAVGLFFGPEKPQTLFKLRQ